VAGADSQARGAFIYGGGGDFLLSKHFSLRAEYRGFVYKSPDFGLSSLNSDAVTHTAQPSAGIVFRFGPRTIEPGPSAPRLGGLEYPLLRGSPRWDSPLVGLACVGRSNQSAFSQQLHRPP
jgi:hypothetical protein